ncbi:MAG: hypothetical protein INR64_05330, partial [Caulobacteraceae bacterium]|nr:hypothetical protein [Caulobacter sp.]
MDAPSAAPLTDAAGARDLPAALVVLPGPRAAVDDGAGGCELAPGAARQRMQREPALVAHASLTARRLGLSAPP